MGSGLYSSANINQALEYNNSEQILLGTTIPLGGGMSFMSSTFSGWGSVIGSWQNFNQVQFYVKPWNTLITSIRVRILTNSSTGTLLADKTFTVTTTLNTQDLITCTFDSSTIVGGENIIRNLSGDVLWMEYYCNARTGVYGRSPVTFAPQPGTYAQARYSTTSNTTNLATSLVTGGFEIYTKVYGYGEGLQATTSFLARLKQQLGLTSSITLDDILQVEILLTSNIYAVEGIESNIYFNEIIDSKLPLDIYNINITCTKGKQLEDCYRVTPLAADAGTHSLTIDITFAGITVASKSVTLNIAALTAGTGVTRKVLIVGDSTIDAGIVTSNIVDLDAADTNMTVTLVGSRGSGANRHEGYSGKTYNWFYTNSTDPTPSPFVKAGVYNFVQYLIDNAIVLTSNDVKINDSGINDIFGYTDDASVVAKLNSIKSDLDAMIANDRAAVPEIRICICVTIPPSISQDAFGDDYLAAQTRDRYLRNLRLLQKEFIEYYDTDANKLLKIDVISLHASLDTANNMATTVTEINARCYVSVVTGGNDANKLDIESITWQSGNIVRYTFGTGLGTVNLKDVQVDYFLEIAGDGTSANNGKFQIVAISNGTTKYVDVINTSRTNATGDVASGSTGIGLIKKTIPLQTNGVHPDSGGYKQMSDAIWSYVKVKS